MSDGESPAFTPADGHVSSRWDPAISTAVTVSWITGQTRAASYIVGMENSAPSLTPDGHRAVTFLLLV